MRKLFMTFDDLGLAAPLLRALSDEGYTVPTPIQAKAIPPVLTGADLLGIAQTGTGKTAAFALPILMRLAADPKPPMRRGCRTLVLSPTRELATQIAESFRAYGRHQGVTVAVVFGGVGHRPQIQALARGVDVLVATPGRLLDHLAERNIDLSGTEILVLDEADQMLDLGFVKPIRRIVSHLSGRRQNLFFSATMPSEIAGLASEMLRNPVRVSVAPVATTVERVEQRAILIEASQKRQILVQLLADQAMTRTLVFTRTKRGADRVARHLEDAGISSDVIHGNKSQRQREAALEAFKRDEIRVLVATDIAARGIDIDAVSHVINFELPEVPEAYVHRIGRTARAGASGSAISLCDNEERALLRAIEKLTRQVIPTEDRRTGARSDDSDRDDRADRGARQGRRPQRSGGQPSRSGGGYGRSESRGDAAPPRQEFRSGSRGGQARPPSRGEPARPEPRSRDGDRARPEQRGRDGDRARPDSRGSNARPPQRDDRARPQPSRGRRPDGASEQTPRSPNRDPDRRDRRPDHRDSRH